MMAMRHDPGMARPKGGTGALVQALLNLVKSKGGVVLTDQSVQKILIDDGKAVESGCQWHGIPSQPGVISILTLSACSYT